MSGFTPAQRRLILARDVSCIPHAGQCYGPLVVHHRAGRGMGGRKSANVVSNGLTTCWQWNDRVEQDAALAAEAREFGWKLASFEDPATVPVYVPEIGDRVRLDNEGHYLDHAGDIVSVMRV